MLRARSRAVRADDPRRPRAGRPRPDSAGVVGVHRSRSPATRSIRRRPARCSTKPGGAPAPNGIRQRDGRPLAFTLITQAGFAVRENVAQAIERQLRDVGVDVRIELHDGTAISALWFEGRFDAMLHWWQMPADPELTMFFAADRTPPAGQQHQLLQGRRADPAALRVGPHGRSRGAQARCCIASQAIIADAVPEIPLYSVTQLDAVPRLAAALQGQPDQHRDLLERARVGNQVGSGGQWRRVATESPSPKRRGLAECGSRPTGWRRDRR